jgi:hypothetical protein
MKIFIVIILLFVNSGVFAETKCFGYLAKLDTQSNQPGITSQTILPYPKIDIEEVFNIFLRAVDQGQMRLFDKTLTRDILDPIRVEYIYTPEDPYPRINVFSELLIPMPLPAMPDVFIMGVTGVMDVDGNIKESIAHCDIEG